MKQKSIVCKPEINESNLMAYLDCMFMCDSPRLSVSEDVGTIDGSGVAGFFRTSKHFKKDPQRGDHPGAQACYVNTACADEELMRNYIQHPEKGEKKNKNIPSYSG